MHGYTEQIQLTFDYVLFSLEMNVLLATWYCDNDICGYQKLFVGANWYVFIGHKCKLMYLANSILIYNI